MFQREILFKKKKIKQYFNKYLLYFLIIFIYHKEEKILKIKSILNYIILLLD
jgi:hypothetical protein